jgi:hypothetical protein
VPVLVSVGFSIRRRVLAASCIRGDRIHEVEIKRRVWSVTDDVLTFDGERSVERDAWHSACSGHGYNEPMSGSDRVKPAGPGLKLTYDDFVLFPDDGKRHELIDGEHYVTPSSNTRHPQICGDLFALIWNYLEAHPIGRAFGVPLDVVFSP